MLNKEKKNVGNDFDQTIVMFRLKKLRNWRYLNN